MEPKPPVILMYHGTPDRRSGSDIYSLEARLFLRHLDYLAENGWHTLTLGDLMTGKEYPERSVVLTFDDGYEDNFENAFLPLQARGMVATWFIVASAMGGVSDWLQGEDASRPLMSREQVLELHRQGMEIGSHGHRHVRLSHLSPGDQFKEMVDSKHTLEDLLNDRVAGFAFPYGDYNKDSMLALRKAGYSYACVTRSGRYNPKDPVFQLRRVTIYSGDDEKVLSRKLVFADNDVSRKKIFRYYLRRIGLHISSLGRR